MSMEIADGYSNYATNYTDSTKKSDSKSAAEVKANRQAGSEGKVQEYYEKLCKKFPQINFNTNGGVLPGNSSKVTVNLSYDCLKKMASNPEFAKEIEWNLSGEAAANSMVYGWAERRAANEARTETGEYTVSATGTDIKAVTQSVVSESSVISVPTGASFDIKA